MFSLFFFILLNGVYTPLDVGLVYSFETFDACADVGQLVVDTTNKDLQVGKVVWICEEINA